MKIDSDDDFLTATKVSRDLSKLSDHDKLALEDAKKDDI